MAAKSAGLSSRANGPLVFDDLCIAFLHEERKLQEKEKSAALSSCPFPPHILN